MSAGAVRAGKAFVEISANDTQFQRAMKRVQHGVVRVGQMMRQIGSGMAMAGGAMGLPMILAARSAATFEDALLELKASVGDLSEKELTEARNKALQLSRDLGVAPEKASQAFALLAKAGVEFRTIMDEAAKTAVEFAKISGIEASASAEFMSDAMNTFGVSAEEAANTLSAAADSSSTSIASMVESFALVASVGRGTGQTLFGLSEVFAVLAGYGIKGEEAGTGVKTMLTKLISPAKDAREALDVLGISMGDLVDEMGTPLPARQLSKVFHEAMSRMDGDFRKNMLKNKSLVDVFDVRGIRVIQALADAHAKGKFDKTATSMEHSRTVAEKFQIAMSGISGSFERLYAAVQRLAIAFMVGAAPALRVFAAAAVPLMDVLSFIFTRIPIISPLLAGMAGALFGLGVAALFTGALLGAVNFGLKNFINFSRTYRLACASMTLMTGGLTRALVALRAAIFAIPGWGWVAGLLAIAGVAAGAWMVNEHGKRFGKPKPKGAGIKRDEEKKPLGKEALADPKANAKARGEALATFDAGVAGRLGIGPSLTAAEETADNTERMAEGIDELVRQGQAQLDHEGIQLPGRDNRMPWQGPDGKWNVPGKIPKEIPDAVARIEQRIAKPEIPTLPDIFAIIRARLMPDDMPELPTLVARVNTEMPKFALPNMPKPDVVRRSLVAPGIRRDVAARSDTEMLTVAERTAMASEQAATLLRRLLEKTSNGGLQFA